MNYSSTKVITLGSCAFRQWRAADGRPDAGANSARCSKIHGYNLYAKFYFSASALDERNWVMDFGSLKTLKSMLEHQFDHTLCVAEDDPCLPLFRQLHDQGACDLRIMPAVGIEKTAEFCFNAANEFVNRLTNGRVWCTQVEVWEHENNSAIYSNPKSAAPVSPGASVAAVAPSAPVLINEAPGRPAPIPAPVGNPVSSGFSDLFKGTSWGRS